MFGLAAVRLALRSISPAEPLALASFDTQIISSSSTSTAFVIRLQIDSNFSRCFVLSIRLCM